MIAKPGDVGMEPEIVNKGKAIVNNIVNKELSFDEQYEKYGIPKPGSLTKWLEERHEELRPSRP